MKDFKEFQRCKKDKTKFRNQNLQYKFIVMLIDAKLYGKGIFFGNFCLFQMNVTFFPPKAGLVWKFFSEVAQKSQIVLKPKAEGQSDSFGLLKERISRLDPTQAEKMTF